MNITESAGLDNTCAAFKRRCRKVNGSLWAHESDGVENAKTIGLRVGGKRIDGW